MSRRYFPLTSEARHGGALNVAPQASAPQKWEMHHFLSEATATSRCLMKECSRHSGEGVTDVTRLCEQMWKKIDVNVDKFYLVQLISNAGTILCIFLFHSGI